MIFFTFCVRCYSKKLYFPIEKVDNNNHETSNPAKILHMDRHMITEAPEQILTVEF